MPSVESPNNPIGNGQQVRDEWIGRVTSLVDQVEKWAREQGWRTRRIDKRLEDTEIGTHQVPALLLQEGTTQLLLEPIGRSAPGVDGVVDLYAMPAYDDMATLYHTDSGWRLHYLFPGTVGVSSPRDAKGRPLNGDTLREVLEEIQRHAA